MQAMRPSSPRITESRSSAKGGRIGVEEPLHAEPTYDTPAQLLGERGQIGLGDRPGRQLSTAGGLPAGGPAARHGLARRRRQSRTHGDAHGD